MIPLQHSQSQPVTHDSIPPSPSPTINQKWLAFHLTQVDSTAYVTTCAESAQCSSAAKAFTMVTNENSSSPGPWGGAGREGCIKGIAKRHPHQWSYTPNHKLTRNALANIPICSVHFEKVYKGTSQLARNGYGITVESMSLYLYHAQRHATTVPFTVTSSKHVHSL